MVESAPTLKDELAELGNKFPLTAELLKRLSVFADKFAAD